MHVGYHLYYQPPPLTSASGASMPLPRQGPVREPSGTVMVVPAVAELRQALATVPLGAGDYLLVPVDAAGDELDDVQPIEIKVPPSGAAFDFTGLMNRALAVIEERLAADAELKRIHDGLTKSDQAVMIASMRLAAADFPANEVLTE